MVSTWKKILTSFLLTVLLAVCFVFPCFANDLPTSFNIDVWNSYIGTPSEMDLYSISQDGQRTLVITDNTPTNTENGVKKWLIFIPVPVNFVEGASYHFDFVVTGAMRNGVLTSINSLAVLFADVHKSFLDNGAESTSNSVFNMGLQVPSGARYIVLSIVPSVPSGNRAYFYISQLRIDVINTADMGGSFSDTEPTMPIVDIDSYVSDIGTNGASLIDTLSNGFLAVSGSVQKVAMFFSYIWGAFSYYSPALVYVVSFVLVFGALAMILNIFGHAKAGGRQADNAKWRAETREYRNFIMNNMGRKK